MAAVVADESAKTQFRLKINIMKIVAELVTHLSTYSRHLPDPILESLRSAALNLDRVMTPLPLKVAVKVSRPPRAVLEIGVGPATLPDHASLLVLRWNANVLQVTGDITLDLALHYIQMTDHPVQAGSIV